MVKGISRQVIVVHSPDPKLFEEAIFILKEDALGRDGVTEDALLKEATHLISGHRGSMSARNYLNGPAWACIGALLTSVAWLFAVLL